MEGERGEQFRRWSGDREQCGRAWSLIGCGLGRLCLLWESDPEEQGLCGYVERATKEQEMLIFFFRGTENTEATRWEVLVVYDTAVSPSVRSSQKQKWQLRAAIIFSLYSDFIGLQLNDI